MSLEACHRCLYLHNAESLLVRLAKGERIPVTSQLRPLVDSAPSKWDLSVGHDLEEQQVSAKAGSCCAISHCLLQEQRTL